MNLAGMVGGVCLASFSTAIMASAEDLATMPDPAAAAVLQKAQADAKKAEADARKALVDARSAELEASQKILPNSGKTTAVTANEAAGQVEAELLANRELTRLTAVAAQAINQAIDADCRKCGARNIVILSSGEDIQLAHLRTFSLRKTAVTAALEHANKAYGEEIEKAAGKKGETKALGLVASAATAVVQLANLASYFATTSQVGGMTMTPNDQAMTATLVANLRRVCGKNDVYIASRVGTPTATDKVVQDLIALDELAYLVSNHLADAKARAARAKKGHKGEAAIEAAKPWDDVAANLSKAIDGYNSFVGVLGDEEGGLPLSIVLREQAMSDLLERGQPTYQVFPTYVTAGGGYYTQTNLWTFSLGVLPFHVSGGSGISYAVLRASDGGVVDGGTVEGETSYIPIKDVAARLDKVKTYAVTDTLHC